MAIVVQPVISISGGEVVFSIEYDDAEIEGYTPIDEDNPVAFPYYSILAMHFLNTGSDTWYVTFLQDREAPKPKELDHYITPGMDERLDIKKNDRPLTFYEEITCTLQEG